MSDKTEWEMIWTWQLDIHISGMYLIQSSFHLRNERILNAHVQNFSLAEGF